MFSVWLFYLSNLNSCTCACADVVQTCAVTYSPVSSVTRKTQCPSIVPTTRSTRTTWSTSAEETRRPHACDRQWSPPTAHRMESSHSKMTRSRDSSTWPLPFWPRRILAGTFVVCKWTVTARVVSPPLKWKWKVRDLSFTRSCCGEQVDNPTTIYEFMKFLCPQSLGNISLSSLLK